MGWIVTGRQGMVSVDDAQRVVYPHGLALRALEDAPERLTPPIVFRSRLEADWANTLDWLGIQWSYEPQLFTLPNGQQYLPDYHLPELGTWLEVKGPGVPRLDKTIAFARWRQDDLVVAGFSPALIPGRKFAMHFRGVLNRCGLALCPDCRRYQWATEAMGCRACRARIPESNFYQHHDAPFHPAQWSGWRGA